MVKGTDVELGLTRLDGWMTHGTLRGQLARVVWRVGDKESR